VQLNAAGTELLLQDSSTGARERGTLFTRSMDGSPPVQVSSAAGLALTSDGAWIATLGDGSTYTTRSSMITLVPTGGGKPRTFELPVEVEYGAWNQLGTNIWELRNPEFSDDNERLLLPLARDANGRARAYVLDLDDGGTRPVTPEGVPGPFVLSPDGQFVAGAEPDGLYVYSVDTGERRRLPGEPDPGKLARWSEDRQSLYVVEQDGAAASIFERDIETGERALVRRVRAPDPAGIARFDVWVARNGQAFAYSLARVSENLVVLENFD
jgi:dipeptidyl aminopeptidase/acylaminoacyl peptidase